MISHHFQEHLYNYQLKQPGIFPILVPSAIIGYVGVIYFSANATIVDKEHEGIVQKALIASFIL